MGNICRSPTAEAVFTALVKKKNMVDEFVIDSAGTHSYHIGSHPDKRSIQAAIKRGIQMQHLQARQVVTEDFERFDYFIVMDEANKQNLRTMFPNAEQSMIFPMMSFAKDTMYVEVPDPYYGEDDGFELVLDLLEQASLGLYEFLSNDSSNSL
jgi:protein-tyrosine phosphatase